MSRFRSAVHNIGHHAVSGLCDLLSEGYSYCESEGKAVLTIDLISSERVLTNTMESEIVKIKDKAASIMATTCGVTQHEIASAELSINYRFTDDAYRLHKEHMKSIGIWYGHDPLYDAVIEYKLKNGTVAKSEFSNKNMY
ncbi:hypothetical protein L4C34_10050 [Vibrio profundum]|uniref:hypothetical protein n=1 Tax=Vibrio profundum TaxID=2910247 RepID=UPI003D12813A